MARILANTLILVWLDNRRINSCTTALCTAGQDRDKSRTNSRVISKALFHLRSKHMELHHLHQLQTHTHTHTRTQQIVPYGHTPSSWGSSGQQQAWLEVTIQASLVKGIHLGLLLSLPQHMVASDSLVLAGLAVTICCPHPTTAPPIYSNKTQIGIQTQIPLQLGTRTRVQQIRILPRF
jgi:hypothetical protein